jgi:hypothetical protein
MFKHDLREKKVRKGGLSCKQHVIGNPTAMGELLAAVTHHCSYLICDPGNWKTGERISG